LHGGRLPTSEELLYTDPETLRRIGLSRAKSMYLHDLAARLVSGRLDLVRSGPSMTTRPGPSSPRSRVWAGPPPRECLCWRCVRPDVWPAADLALRRTVERIWGLDGPPSVADAG
jgi:DNA-3-methyladenine glycosylase II